MITAPAAKVNGGLTGHRNRRERKREREKERERDKEREIQRETAPDRGNRQQFDDCSVLFIDFKVKTACWSDRASQMLCTLFLVKQINIQLQLFLAGGGGDRTALTVYSKTNIQF